MLKAFEQTKAILMKPNRIKSLNPFHSNLLKLNQILTELRIINLIVPEVDAFPEKI